MIKLLTSAFDMIVLLSSGPHSVKFLSSKLHLNERTVYRYLNVIAKAGFLITKTKAYELGRRRKQYSITGVPQWVRKLNQDATNPQTP